ncbi:hypothetical protein chiPu_0026670, partial [Chiloscyllium punctatum]|nr:hypothetical protein [Chiloscyllium punctatum]
MVPQLLLCCQSLNECLIAYRTRSKWPLNNVSLGLLEAELKAPDITADMYDQGGQDDVYWQNWMNALMNDLEYEGETLAVPISEDPIPRMVIAS